MRKHFISDCYFLTFINKVFFNLKMHSTASAFFVLSLLRLTPFRYDLDLIFDKEETLQPMQQYQHILWIANVRFDKLTFFPNVFLFVGLLYRINLFRKMIPIYQIA